MLKRIKQIKNKRLIVADALLVAALVIAFAVTYDISKHAGLYLLSGEILVAAVMLVRSGTGYVYLQSQEDKNGRNLDLVKTVNGKDYFQNRQLITLSDEAVTASATGKVVFYVVNLYALVKFFERKGYTVSTDKSVFFESDETALKVQERFDCEKLDDRADFKVEFTPAA